MSSPERDSSRPFSSSSMLLSPPSSTTKPGSSSSSHVRSGSARLFTSAQSSFADALIAPAPPVPSAVPTSSPTLIGVRVNDDSDAGPINHLNLGPGSSAGAIGLDLGLGGMSPVMESVGVGVPEVVECMLERGVAPHTPFDPQAVKEEDTQEEETESEVDTDDEICTENIDKEKALLLELLKLCTANQNTAAVTANNSTTATDTGATNNAGINYTSTPTAPHTPGGENNCTGQGYGVVGEGSGNNYGGQNRSSAPMSGSGGIHRSHFVMRRRECVAALLDVYRRRYERMRDVMRVRYKRFRSRVMTSLQEKDRRVKAALKESAADVNDNAHVKAFDDLQVQFKVSGAEEREREREREKGKGGEREAVTKFSVVGKKSEDEEHVRHPTMLWRVQFGAPEPDSSDDLSSMEEDSTTNIAASHPDNTDINCITVKREDHGGLSEHLNLPEHGNVQAEETMYLFQQLRTGEAVLSDGHGSHRRSAPENMDIDA